MSFSISEEDEKSDFPEENIENKIPIKDDNASDVVEVELSVGLGDVDDVKIEEIVRNELDHVIDTLPMTSNDDSSIGGGGWKFTLDDAQSNADPE